MLGALLAACAAPPSTADGAAALEETAATPTPASAASAGPDGSPGPAADVPTSAEEEIPLPPRQDAPAIVAARLPGDGFVDAGNEPGQQCVHYFWLSPDGPGLPDGVVVRVSEVVVEPRAMVPVPGPCRGEAPACAGGELSAQVPGCEILLAPGGGAAADFVRVGLLGTVHCQSPGADVCRRVHAHVANAPPAALRVPVVAAGEQGSPPPEDPPTAPPLGDEAGDPLPDGDPGANPPTGPDVDPGTDPAPDAGLAPDADPAPEEPAAGQGDG